MAGDVLETGSFGSVYVCTRDGQEFVLKKIPVESIEDANEAHEEVCRCEPLRCVAPCIILSCSSWPFQAKRLQGLKHPNIVRYYDDFLHTEYGGSLACPPPSSA